MFVNEIVMRCSFLLCVALVLISAVLPNAYAQQNLPAPPQATTELAQDESAEVSQGDFNERQVALTRRRGEVEYDSLKQERACYSRFLVNYCLAKVRTAKRAQQAALRTEQLALDDAERAARAQHRAQQVAQKQAEQAAAAASRQAEEQRAKARYLEKQRQYDLKQARRASAEPQHRTNAQAYADKQTAHQRKLEAARAQGKQDAQRRADNAKRFAAKQRAAALHQAKIERRQQARGQGAPSNSSPAEPDANVLSSQ